MNFKKTVKEYGITNLERFSYIQKKSLAIQVAEMISNKFDYINYDYIYNKILSTQIFFGKIGTVENKAIYAYDDDTLIIDNSLTIGEISPELLYECIHTIQDRRNKKGKLQQLGQVTFTSFKENGIALNESAVQFIVSKVFERENTVQEVYGIRVNTILTNRNILIFNILEQLKFVIGEKQLVKSTIYATDDFIIDGYDTITKTTFCNVKENMDRILFAEEEIISLKRDINENNIRKSTEQINENIKLIQKLYMECQIEIFKSYFDILYNTIHTIFDLTFYKNKLEEYKNLIGVSIYKENDFMMQYYDTYYKKRQEELIEKENQIKVKNDFSLVLLSNNIISKLFTKIREISLRILNREK